MNKLRVAALTCSLKPSPAESSTDILTQQVLDEFKKHGGDTEMLRVVDYAIKPGVEADMGDGDAWPLLRQKILDADIFILGTPTWVGHMSSEAQRVIERLDAELSYADESGRLKTYNKVALAVVVGNEDGAHKISGDIFQSLNDLGFTIPAGGVVYWNGEAMSGTDYKDLKQTPKSVATTLKRMVTNAAHLAELLRQQGYPEK